MKHLLSAFGLLLLTTACVPKNQYEALVTERNYYRNQAAMADSLAEQRSINTYDNVGAASGELEQRIRQVESLTATNIALSASFQDLESRYRDLLTQNQNLLTSSGSESAQLQQTLAERSADLSRRDAELRQLELDLRAREQQVSSLESAYAPAGGGAAKGPATYGRVTATSPLNPVQNATLTLNTIQSELGQILTNQPAGTYLLSNAGSNRLQLVLREDLLYRDGYAISPGGQNLLRALANTLRNYPAAEFTVVGHADGAQPNPLRAFEDSTDRSINVANQLITFGLNPSRVVAAGKGFYDPVTGNDSPEGRMANRRTELLITIPQ